MLHNGLLNFNFFIVQAYAQSLNLIMVIIGFNVLTITLRLSVISLSGFGNELESSPE
jgi:hypothetical protein